MIYNALVSYMDPFKDPETGAQQEEYGFITFLVESSSVDEALEKLKIKLLDLHDKNENYFDVNSFFLEDLIELDEVPTSAKQLSHFIPHQFNDMSGLILNSDPEGDPNIRHFTINSEDEEEPKSLLDVDRDRRITRPLFKTLCRMKNRGILPEFNDLSDGDLYELYVVEKCINREIAELFDVDPKKVGSRRRKADATLEESALYDALVDQGLLEPIHYKGHCDSE